MTELPHWFGKDREERNTRSQRQEKKRAKQVGGRVQAGSGSSWRAPRDIRTPERLEEVKFTDKAIFPLDVRKWLKYEADAQRDGREAALVIDFDQYNVRLIVVSEQYPR